MALGGGASPALLQHVVYEHADCVVVETWLERRHRHRARGGGGAAADDGDLTTANVFVSVESAVHERARSVSFVLSRCIRY